MPQRPATSPLSFTFDSPRRNERWTIADVRRELDEVAAVVRAFATEDVDIEVVSLSKNSPLQLAVRPVSREHRPKQKTAVSKRILSVADSVRKNKKSVKKATEIRALHDFASHLVARQQTAVLAMGGSSVTIDETLLESLEIELGSEYVSLGIWRGQVDIVSLRNPGFFWLYYDFGPKRLKCLFNQDQLEDIRHALGRYTAVSGEIFYNTNDPYPYKLKVHSVAVQSDAPDAVWDEFADLIFEVQS